ncbi:CtsR family transcriptional regulator [Paludicola sp. MB14-C6]|uniref:CtsR family transcriptional regulator n=1 Tax=Paludihabitans sp. MB14-C6 TaxID=3070656 RepID=UPI0027DC4245|nr:CtsR family transcriptional regulator [Paludicola sp. MB14-C6]WMJ23099.1 CtsR family transcriptional regulator [Paludicola sp. MB14-C6]
MNITQLIVDTLQQLLNEQDGTIQIQRNELANKIGCVPSQINYVITSRFTKEQGYIVESRRGGGGYIRIIKLDHSKKELLMHIIQSIGYEIDEVTARAILHTLYHDELITECEAKIMLAAILDNNFTGMSNVLKKAVRACILKSMLMNAI